MPYTKCCDCSFAVDHGNNEWFCHKYREPEKRLAIWEINPLGKRHLPDWAGCGEGESASLARDEWRRYDPARGLDAPRGDSFRAWVKASGESDPPELLVCADEGGAGLCYWQQGDNNTKCKWAKLPAHWQIVAWRPNTLPPKFV